MAEDVSRCTADSGISGEGGVLLSASTIPVRELARGQAPDKLGVYRWHEGQAVRIG